MYGIREITGTIQEIGVSPEFLYIKTDEDATCLGTYGDCCSSTDIHDVIGVKKVLKTGPIVGFRETKASEYCEGYVGPWDDSVQNYGLEIVVDHPEFGEVTCVVSYRNNSNGYYGGNLEYDGMNKPLGVTQIFDDALDIIEAEETP